MVVAASELPLEEVWETTLLLTISELDEVGESVADVEEGVSEAEVEVGVGEGVSEVGELLLAVGVALVWSTDVDDGTSLDESEGESVGVSDGEAAVEVTA